jgi:hypothetical protein
MPSTPTTSGSLLVILGKQSERGTSASWMLAEEFPSVLDM